MLIIILAFFLLTLFVFIMTYNSMEEVYVNYPYCPYCPYCPYRHRKSYCP